jgi:hypothetical protein
MLFTTMRIWCFGPVVGAVAGEQTDTAAASLLLGRVVQVTVVVPPEAMVVGGMYV